MNIILSSKLLDTNVFRCIALAAGKYTFLIDGFQVSKQIKTTAIIELLAL